MQRVLGPRLIGKLHSQHEDRRTDCSGTRERFAECQSRKAYAFRNGVKFPGNNFPMTLIPVRRGASTLAIAVLSVSVAWAADQARPTPSSTKTASTVQRPTPTSRSTSGRGPLPDPVLLDGSSQPAEKKTEYGMLGDFELPGDENARSDKVGGQQNPNGQKGGSGGIPPGQQQAGGGGQQGQLPQGAQGGGAGGEQQQAANAQGGGAQGGGAQGGAASPENPNAAGSPIAGAGEAGAQPDGVQVKQLGGLPGQQGAGAAGAGDKPSQVAIGDSAMRIEPSAGAAGIVGGQQQQVAGKTQQHEKGTGTGGKGPSGAGGGNRVEKGRTIPSGL